MKKIILTTSLILSLLGAGAAQAQASSPNLHVTSAADLTIQAGLRAFKKGDYKKAVMFNQRALENGLSRKRKAIVHSNLCATYNAMNDYSRAQQSCRAALQLRPEYSPALANSNFLQVKLAKK